MSAHSALQRAQSLTQISRWDEAIAALEPALSDQGTAAEARCILAQCQLAKGERKEAIASAESALSLNPSSEWAHRLLAHAHLGRGRNKKALEHAEEAVRILPTAPEPLYLLAKIHLARGNRDQAAGVSRISLAANPHSPLAHLTAGDVASDYESWAHAEAHYRDGLAQDPQNSDLSLGLAEALRRQGRKDEAKDTYIAAARMDPTDHRARQGLAKVGVPILGGGLILAAKIGAWGGLQAFFRTLGDPVILAAIVAGILCLGALYDVGSRIRATRDLPEQVRRGLRADHLNAGLRWVQAAAGISILFAIWCFLASEESGGGAARGWAFIAAAIALWTIAHVLWSGAKLDLKHIATSPLRLLGRRAA